MKVVIDIDNMSELALALLYLSFGCTIIELLCFMGPGIVEHPPPVQGNTNRRSVTTLRPSAKDAYMLFQVYPVGGSSFLHSVTLCSCLA